MVANQDPGLRKGNRRQKTAAIGAALLSLAACTSAVKGNGTAESTSPALSAPAPSPTTQPEVSPIEKAIQTFGINLNQKQVATIAMNTCVAWSNQSGGVTVTYNPGVAKVIGTNPQQHGEVLVFGSSVGTKAEGYPKPSLIVSDGPGTFYDGTQVDDAIAANVEKIFYDKSKNPSIDSRVSQRHVSSTLEANGALGDSYRDDITGQPVVMTELLQNQELGSQAVSATCDAMRGQTRHR